MDSATWLILSLTVALIYTIRVIWDLVEKSTQQQSLIVRLEATLKSYSVMLHNNKKKTFKTHAMARTSPKGEEWVGKCLDCGKEGLKLTDMHTDPCKSNKSSDQSLVDMLAHIEREEDDSTE